jgi:mevalonate kinase
VLDYARQAREAWDAYAARPDPARFLALRGDDPAHIVKVALGEAAAAGGERIGERRGAGAPRPRLRLRLDSELPLGSGFGSSAAAAVAVIGGYLAWRSAAVGIGTARPAADHAGSGSEPREHGRPEGPIAAGLPAGTPETFDAEAIERLAHEAERRQHGLPSGVDTATTLHGGLIWAQRLPSGELGWERLAAASPLLARLGVFHTGTPPEPTGAVVAAVRARRDLDPAGHDRLFDRMAAAARAFRAELDRAAEDPARVVALIREHQACLEALGVVPGPVRSVVRRVEAEGGAAKVSGAGSLAGPGAGSLLVYHADPGRLAGWDFLRPFRRYPVHLGAAGFRWETP